MQILARVHLYPPEHCAGAERMLQAMLEALVDAGHEVRVFLQRRSRSSAPYDLNGVHVYPKGSMNWLDHVGVSDVVITHLDCTSEVVGVAAAIDKPVIQVLHNTHSPTRMWASCKADLLVYNSEWMAKELGPHPNSIIVRPPVKVQDYNFMPKQGEGVITLVNTSQAKGGVLFAQLAALMPDLRFLGVDGAYGEQLHTKLPNTAYIPHAAMEMPIVYSLTEILLVPSEYESWGRVGIEAMACGIPVIAHPTPGLLESLSDAGTFVDRDDLDMWVGAIRNLLERPDVYAKASQLAVERAAALDPTDDLARWVEAVEAL